MDEDQTQDLISQLQTDLRKSQEARLEARIADFKARGAVAVVTDGEFEARCFYGLQAEQCEVLRGKPAAGIRWSDHTYYVLPKPGFEAVSEYERARRKRCKENRAIRHATFQRLRRLAKRATESTHG